MHSQWKRAGRKLWDPATCRSGQRARRKFWQVKVEMAVVLKPKGRPLRAPTLVLLPRWAQKETVRPKRRSRRGTEARMALSRNGASRVACNVRLSFVFSAHATVRGSV